jgi:hypothetical protein
MKMEAIVPPTFTGLHGVGFQKLGLFTVATVRPLEHVGSDRQIMLKWIFKKQTSGSDWIQLTEDTVTVVGP